MKKLLPIILVLFTVTSTLANPVNTASNGAWKANSTWTLNRKPQDGDTVVIPAGKTVVINDVQNLSSAQLYIKVFGILKFSGGKLWLDNNSTIIVYSGGSVVGTGSSSETLKIGGVDKYWGHVDATILGPASANKSTGTSPLGFSLGNIVPLPVRFIGFDLVRKDEDVLVQWSTAEEINCSYYAVQRSEDGNDWHTIANVNAAGSSMLTNSYSYTDYNVAVPVVYYRIRQVDIDGKFTTTPVRLLKNDNAALEIKANATSNSICVNFSQKVSSDVLVRLTSMSGQMVCESKLDAPIGQVIVPVQNVMKGIYVVTVSNGRDIRFSKQFLL